MKDTIYHLACSLVDAQRKTGKGYATAKDFVAVMMNDDRFFEAYSGFFRIPGEPNNIHFGRNIREAMRLSPEFRKLTSIKKINNLAHFRFYGEVDDDSQFDWDMELISPAAERAYDKADEAEERRRDELSTPKTDQKRTLFIHFGGLTQEDLLFLGEVSNKKVVDEIKSVIKKNLLKKR